MAQLNTTKQVASEQKLVTTAKRRRKDTGGTSGASFDNIFIPMLFSGGLVASYMINAQILGLKDTYNNFNVNVSNGMFAAIDGKVQEWTPDLYAIMSEDVWNLAYSSDGHLYAIPVAKDIAPMNFIVYDKSFAEANGFEIPERLENWDDLTDYLVALQGSMAEGEYAFEIGGSPAGWDTSFDFIDRMPLIGVIVGSDESTKVVVEFDDPTIIDRLHTMRKWYTMGLINPDAATLNESSIDSKHNHIKTVQAWTGYDYSPSWGYPCGMTCCSGPILSTDS